MKFIINLEKKHFYFFSFLIGIFALAVFVYAVVPNPGHAISEIDWSETISVLYANEICLAGTCKTTWPTSLWTSSGNDIYYNAGGNVGIGTTNIQGQAPGGGTSGNLDVADIYLRSTGDWASQIGTNVLGGGYISQSVSRNVGSDWTLISINGVSVGVDDNSAAGGFVYDLGWTKMASLCVANGVCSHFALSTTEQCTSSDGYALCAKLDASDNLIIRTGSNIRVTYVVQ